jgi:long-subunit acyl-CoA synthetase (AMP-forming)
MDAIKIARKNFEFVMQEHGSTIQAIEPYGEGNAVLANHPNLIADRLAQVAAEEVATIIYTSGSSGSYPRAARPR